MADDKKKAATAAPSPGWNLDAMESIIVLLIFLAIASTVIPAIYSYITSGEISFYGFKLKAVFDFFKSNSQFFKALGYSIAGLGAIATFSFTKMADAVWAAEKAKLFPAVMETNFESVASVSNPRADRWKKILALSESQNSSEWRLSIIEADIILDELLEKLRLPGNTMGEKLKAVEPSDFTTIEYAWEAHKARNMIAHEGNDFLLNQREVRRIISLYGAVFKEFEMI